MNNISPIDGRYRNRFGALRKNLCEKSITDKKILVEINWLLNLSIFHVIPEITSEVAGKLSNLLASDYQKELDEIEKEVKHDVKAIELLIARHVPEVAPYVHIGLTSEDVNSIAYALYVRDYSNIHLYAGREFNLMLCKEIKAHSDTMFPALTHGQMASPTTYGKELSVHVSRLDNILRQINRHRFYAKLNGSTGTLSALQTAYPLACMGSWVAVASDFLHSFFDLESEIATTQISNNDSIIHYLNLLEHFNNILLDFDQDMWEYTSRGFLKQKVNPNEVGSSVMPHKVNPINFENSEGNVCVANALLHAIATKLSHSRMQRDLSNSTVRRNLGVAFAHSHLALLEAVEGFKRVELDQYSTCMTPYGELSLKSEAIQTILRKHGVPNAYMKIKDIFRGHTYSDIDLNLYTLINTLPDEVKLEIQNVLQNPPSVGLSSMICANVVRNI